MSAGGIQGRCALHGRTDGLRNADWHGHGIWNRYGIRPRRDLRNATTTTEWNGRWSSWWVFLLLLAFESFLLTRSRFHPGMIGPDGVPNRTVYLGGINPATTVKELCDVSIVLCRLISCIARLIGSLLDPLRSTSAAASFRTSSTSQTKESHLLPLSTPMAPVRSSTAPRRTA